MGQLSARHLSLFYQRHLKGRAGAATLALTVAYRLVALEERTSPSSRRSMPAPCQSMSSMDSRHRLFIWVGFQWA